MGELSQASTDDPAFIALVAWKILSGYKCPVQRNIGYRSHTNPDSHTYWDRRPAGGIDA